MRLSSSTFRLPLTFAALSIAVLSTVTAVQPAGAQETGLAAGPQQTVAGSTQHAISLVPLTDQELAAQSLSTGAKTSATTAANFREFGSMRAGQVVEAKPLTLHFATAAKVTRIESTSDFTVEQGGSCVEGNSYAANATCTLMMRFTPQGPGWRLGKVQITDSADLTPFYVGLGGYGAAPAISFTPSIINTVAGTSVSGVGVFSGATNLAVDGGDSVYIADTGNNRVESISPSGTLQNMTSSFGATAPIGVAVDHNGFLYFTQRAQYYFLYILPSPNTETYYSSGSNSCAIGSTCPLNGTSISYSYVGALATDPNGNVFLNYFGSAARLVPSPSIFAEDYIPLDTPYNYNSDAYTSPQSLAVDNSDTLYTYYNDGSGAECEISGESYYNAYSNVFNPVKVAGGTCGFSGDGGQARAAQISSQIGQMTFDIAGNLYFTDTLNQRIRRIDNVTGVITTVAGNGVIGNGGDYGPATSATLINPVGVAVDSQGQIYILSSSATTSAAQLLRKVGTVGALSFGATAVGSSTAAQTVTVANTGNSDLDFTHVGFSGGNTSDFTMDVNTTSCNFTVPLATGRSCKIGFIFKPTATGIRSTVLSITDDTIAGVNTVQLTGTGATTATLTPSSLSFASTSVGSTSSSQTVTLANTGTAALTISSIAFSGATAYTDTTTCGSTLAVGASCTIAISFKPTAAGAQTGTLTVTDTAVTSRQTVSLTGTGVASAAKASISPTSLSFPSTAVGATSAAQVITLSNTGGAALGVTSIKVAGTNSPDYTQTNTCGTSVAAGGSCKITVTFKPTGTGTRTASVAITASTGNLTATVSGTAVAAAKKPVLSPSATSFGSQAVSIPSGARMMTLTNSTGVAMNINSWTWSGLNGSDFSQTHSCGTTMAAGASCLVSVVFRPTAVGTRTASMTVNTSAGAMVATVTGVGIGAEGQPHQGPLPGGFVPKSTLK